MTLYESALSVKVAFKALFMAVVEAVKLDQACTTLDELLSNSGHSQAIYARNKDYERITRRLRYSYWIGN